MTALPPLLRWSPGRQGTGYRKLPIARGQTWDVYVIDYPAGSSVPTHRDPVEGKRHYRLNVTVWGDANAFAGHCVNGDDLQYFWRLTLFRPDTVYHSVRLLTSRRIVISIGWVR